MRDKVGTKKPCWDKAESRLSEINRKGKEWRVSENRRRDTKKKRWPISLGIRMAVGRGENRYRFGLKLNHNDEKDFD